MRYKLLKDLPWIKNGSIIEKSAVWEWYYDVWEFTMKEEMLKRNKDFFEPIVEKISYDTLTKKDKVYFIDYNWEVSCWSEFTPECCRSETFATREEAEDEHKRREWRVRRDKFIPEEWEEYWYSMMDSNPSKTENNSSHVDLLKINDWIAFKTKEECQDAIDNHDIVRLFYTII